LICPNCGRRNSAGATFCSRCRQRLPLAAKLNGNHRRTVMVEPRGGGGSGAIVLGVALLAGFLFIGGAAALYLSNPPSDGDPTDISFASMTPTLPIFVQPTATPSPSPTFILLPSESPTLTFTPLPTGTTVIPPTVPPSDAPRTPTPPPTPKPIAAKFTWNQVGTTREVNFVDQSTGGPTEWLWTFGDDSGSESQQNPSHTYDAYGTYTVKLVVTGPGGTDTKTKTITLQPPATPTPSPSDTPTPTPAPTPTPTPSNGQASSEPTSSEIPTP